MPVIGDNYVYIYCLWVSGSFKNKGYGRELLEYCLDEAKEQKKSGVCIISSKKKKPFLSDKKFMEKFGFVSVDSIDDDYELLALSFDGSIPKFNKVARQGNIDSQDLTIYYSLQCPYIPNCIEEVKNYCERESVPLRLFEIKSASEAKVIPCVFNNWAVFYKGKFKTLHLLNEGYLKKMLNV